MEEVKNQTEQTQNVDNVLSSVSDQYLRKKKRNKTIIFSTISAVVLALVITIIVLASITINLKPYFITRPSTLVVYTNSSLSFSPNDDNEEEFYSIYENSFDTTILTALFTGRLGAYEIVEGRTGFYSDATNKQGLNDTVRTSLGSNYIHLYYGQAQMLYNANGSAYTSRRDTSKEFYYNDVYFNITNEDQEQDVTFYFGAYNGNSTPVIVSITVKANTYAIYDYVTND